MTQRVLRGTSLSGRSLRPGARFRVSAIGGLLALAGQGADPPLTSPVSTSRDSAYSNFIDRSAHCSAECFAVTVYLAQGVVATGLRTCKHAIEALEKVITSASASAITSSIVRSPFFSISVNSWRLPTLPLAHCSANPGPGIRKTKPLLSILECIAATPFAAAALHNPALARRIRKIFHGVRHG